MHSQAIASYLAMTRGKRRCLYIVQDARYRVSRYSGPALGIKADTGLWLRLAQYERRARPQATPILIYSNPSLASLTSFCKTGSFKMVMLLPLTDIRFSWMKSWVTLNQVS